MADGGGDLVDGDRGAVADGDGPGVVRPGDLQPVESWSLVCEVVSVNARHVIHYRDGTTRGVGGVLVTARAGDEDITFACPEVDAFACGDMVAVTVLKVEP